MNRAHQIKQRLLPHILATCQHLLPRGYFDGANWRVGSIQGEAGSSLSVICQGPRAGYWKDFAESDDHKGDLLTLWMMVRRVPFIDALDEAEIWLERGVTAPPSASPDSGCPLEIDVYSPVEMPHDAALDWQQGVDLLAGQPAIQSVLDQSRGWPPGTTARLSQRKLVALTNRRPEVHRAAMEHDAESRG